MHVRPARVALLAAALAFSPATASAQSDADFSNYTLTMDVMHQLSSAGQNLKSVLDKNPALAEALAADEDSWAQSVTALEKSPAAVAALKKGGLTPRAYITAVVAYGQAAMVVSLQQTDKTYEAPADVNPKNIAFVKAHWAEIQKLIGGPGQ